MVSSKLSNRRGTAKKPSLCISPKIPPVTPPPPDWPPASIDLHFQFTFNWEEGPITHEWDLTLDWYIETGTYIGWYWNDENHQAEWYCACPHPYGELWIEGWAEYFDAYAAHAQGVPVTCGKTTQYEITEWQEYSPGMYDILASFLF